MTKNNNINKYRQQARKCEENIKKLNAEKKAIEKKIQKELENYEEIKQKLMTEAIANMSFDEMASMLSGEQESAKAQPEISEAFDESAATETNEAF